MSFSPPVVGGSGVPVGRIGIKVSGQIECCARLCSRLEACDPRIHNHIVVCQCRHDAMISHSCRCAAEARTRSRIRRDSSDRGTPDS